LASTASSRRSATSRPQPRRPPRWRSCRPSPTAGKSRSKTTERSQCWRSPQAKRMTSHRQSITALDARLYRRVRSLLLNHQRAERALVAVVVTQHAWSLAGLAAILADGDRRHRWARANAAMGGAWAAAKLLARTIKRPRPSFSDCPPGAPQKRPRKLPQHTRDGVIRRRRRRAAVAASGTTAFGGGRYRDGAAAARRALPLRRRSRRADWQRRRNSRSPRATSVIWRRRIRGRHDDTIGVERPRSVCTTPRAGFLDRPSRTRSDLAI